MIDEAQRAKNLRKFKRIRMGAFVRFEPHHTVYTVRKVYKEPIGNPDAQYGPPVFEHFLDLCPSLNMSQYTMRIGHMDSTAENLVIEANTPLELNYD